MDLGAANGERLVGAPRLIDLEDRMGRLSMGFAEGRMSEKGPVVDIYIVPSILLSYTGLLYILVRYLYLSDRGAPDSYRYWLSKRGNSFSQNIC